MNQFPRITTITKTKIVKSLGGKKKTTTNLKAAITAFRNSFTRQVEKKWKLK